MAKLKYYIIYALLAFAVFGTVLLLCARSSDKNVGSRAIDTVDVGASANDGTGDPLRTAFIKLNAALYMLDSLGVDELDATDVAYIKETTSAIQAQLNAKAPTASPTFTGTVITAAIRLGGTSLSIDSMGTAATGYYGVYDAADTLAPYTPDAYTDDPYDIFPEIHVFAGDTSNYNTPDKIGDFFINTSTSKLYVSVTAARGGWVILN